MQNYKKEFHLPRWDELPAIDLYMDQVVTCVNDITGKLFEGTGIQPITKSMINNYVKARLVLAPEKKKYGKTSVAMIIIVYFLKNCYTAEEISRLVELGLSLGDYKDTYNHFCDAIENAIFAAFDGEIKFVKSFIPGREQKYLMENIALSFACKYYVQQTFLKIEE